MSRRIVLVAVALVLAAPLFVATFPVAAQPVAKTYRLGVLETAGEVANTANLDAFRQGLSALGLVEGQHVVLEYRSAQGRADRLPDLARELVGLKVDLIVTGGSRAALAAKHATTTTPIVMASSGDPTAEGIVGSLKRPGGNVTGFHALAPPELGGRRLQILREIVPGAPRVGIIWNSMDLQSPLLLRDTERAARALGLQLKSLEVPRAWPTMPSRAFDEVFEAAMLGQVDALIVVEDGLTFTDRSTVVGFASMSRLPAIYGLREFVDAGGLMSYGTDRRDLYRRCAAYVQRVLQGTRPGDLPVEPPTKFELAINLKTARMLGLTIPPALLQRADHVVQ
jgi:putative ABC transport system substrate-binding protein